jgi:arabinogalactan endo-1,4-beta-galactosidase
LKQILLLVLFINVSLPAQTSEFIKGADISFIPQIEDLGGKYYVDGVETDPVEIFKQNQFNYIRLRLWHSPANGYIGLESTLDMASRIKQDSLKFLLNFHYSDWWADPGQQTKPAAWQNLTYSELVDSIYAYTYNVIQTFDAFGALPDMVQIGNEIISGFLWPEGRVGGSYNNPQQWQQFATLLKTARNAVIDAVPDTTIPIMIHIDRGGDNAGSRWFFDNLNNYQVPFDIIGQSFYPWWHGTLTQLSQNLNDLAVRYNKEIIVTEIAYPWTLQSLNDNHGNIVWNSSQLHQGYPSTVEGQFNYLADLIQIVKNVQNNKGVGVIYWAPEYISVQPIGSPWENVTLFDFGGEALSSFAAFHEPDTSGGIGVTFRLNTSTNWDTLYSDGFVQIRGEVSNGSNILPDGERLQWDQSSELIMENINGDYWEKTVQVFSGSEIRYKFWTGHDISNPTFLRLGWEGPIQPYDSIAGNYRKFIAGDTDTILQVEYYNSSGTSVNQYWKPFEHKDDSIAVYFRVNVGGITSTGRFDPDVNGPVGVRGGPVNNLNILSWTVTKVLSREELSVYNGSFWSGVIYYPLSAAVAEQAYKFFIENDTDNGWENNVPDRTFIIPSKDSTINWMVFDGQPVVVSVDDKDNIILDFKLHQNYPNPFNPITRINYELKTQIHTKIIVYNSLGEEINILVNEIKNAGNHFVEWNGRDSNYNDLPSGMYLIRLIAGKNIASIKTILLK